MKLSVGLLLAAVALVNVSGATQDSNVPVPPPNPALQWQPVNGDSVPVMNTPCPTNDGRYTTFKVTNPSTPLDPKQLEGLGPMRTPGDNFGSFGLPGNTKPDGYTTFRPNDPSKSNYKFIEGIGPEVRPGMPGYDNEAAAKAWKDFIAQQNGPGGQGAPTPTCPTTCPEENCAVWGSNGVVYDNECLLAIDRCRYPEKNIQIVSVAPCQLYRAAP